MLSKNHVKLKIFNIYLIKSIFIKIMLNQNDILEDNELI